MNGTSSPNSRAAAAMSASSVLTQVLLRRLPAMASAV
jgi:hypothetical protein